MAHTVFVDGSTVTANRIVAAWLNDADTVTYVRFGDGTSYTGNLTVPGTTSLTGTLTAAAINASGTVAMAGAATVGTTLGVTGALTAGTAGSSVNTISGIDRVLTLVGQTAASTNAFLRFNASSTNKWTIGQYAAGGDQFVVYDDVNAAFGLKIFAGATPSVTIPGALTVTGTSTMAAINASGIFTGTGGANIFTSSNSGAVNSLIIKNTSNTSGSDAVLKASVNSSAGGDPYLLIDTPGIVGWHVGSDSSNSSRFIIGTDVPGAADKLLITTAGAVTIPGTLGVTGNITVGAGSKFTTDAGNDLNLDAPSSRSLFLKIGGSTKVTVDNAGAVTIPGNVGIGTASPVGRLHVVSTYVSDTTVQTRFADNTGGFLDFGGTAGANKWICANDGGTSTAVPLIFQNGSNVERMRIDAAGAVTIPGTLGVGNAGNAGIQLYVTATGTKYGLYMDGSSGVMLYSGINSQTFTSGESATNSALYVRKDSTSSRSISAAGTINASGADYAEYESNGGLVIAKGDVVGFSADGVLTLKFSEAVRFGIKSTNPSYVGGDTFASADALGEHPRHAAIGNEDADEAELAEDIAAYELRLEAARQLVDRVAYSGKVPVNVLDATAGGYIIASDDGGKIAGAFVADVNFEQYKRVVGRVNRVLPDGRAEVAVIVH